MFSKLFNLFKSQPKITPEQEMQAMSIAIAMEARGETVPGLKIESDPRDSRMTRITLDPASALALLESQATPTTKPKTAPVVTPPQESDHDDENLNATYWVMSHVVDPDREMVIEDGPFLCLVEAEMQAEEQADADGLVKNSNLEYHWTRNADDVELCEDFICIEKRVTNDE